MPSLTTVKGPRRQQTMDQLMDVLTSKSTYSHAGRNLQEKEIKRDIVHALQDRLVEIHRELSSTDDEDLLKDKAEESLFWEKSPHATINNFQFFGVQHRPDFEVHLHGDRIAVEVKIGDQGSDIRAGLGQSLVYVAEYDFTAYIFIDNSSDGKVKRSMDNDTESELIQSLWDHYNVRFDVVDL